MICPYLYILLSTFFYFVSNYNSTKMAQNLFNNSEAEILFKFFTRRIQIR